MIIQKIEKLDLCYKKCFYIVFVIKFCENYNLAPPPNKVFGTVTARAPIVGDAAVLFVRVL
jgi:hypothetical protein